MQYMHRLKFQSDSGYPGHNLRLYSKLHVHAGVSDAIYIINIYSCMGMYRYMHVYHGGFVMHDPYISFMNPCMVTKPTVMHVIFLVCSHVMYRALCIYIYMHIHDC